MKKKTIKKVENNDEYEAIIKVLGREYKSTGNTIEEAISKLKPTNCKGRGILSIKHNDNKKDRILMPTVVYRLFNTLGITRQVAIKQASLLFQGI